MQYFINFEPNRTARYKVDNCFSKWTSQNKLTNIFLRALNTVIHNTIDYDEYGVLYICHIFMYLCLLYIANRKYPQ